FCSSTILKILTGLTGFSRIGINPEISYPFYPFTSPRRAVRAHFLAQEFAVIHADGIGTWVGQEVRKAFERNRQVNGFDLHARLRVQVYRREIEHRVDAGFGHFIKHTFGGSSGHGDDDNVYTLAPDYLT